MIDGSYALLDFGRGERLEQWGEVRLVRPDRHAAGERLLGPEAWGAADARFEGRTGAGRWRVRSHVPARWVVHVAEWRFEVGLAPSMHTGLFPEQEAHWAWMLGRAAGVPGPASFLNLFAYTGGASVALASHGHRVTHVDASRPAISWARRNAGLNGVTTIRWIQDDVRRFVDRERRREQRYDGVLLDPPPFGRGSGGPWLLDRDLPDLLAGLAALLPANPVFVLVNAYGASSDAHQLRTMCQNALAVSEVSKTGAIEAGTLSLLDQGGRRLPTGVFVRWPAQAPSAAGGTRHRRDTSRDLRRSTQGQVSRRHVR
jgi:23S rRNA (cytosine1962-C5)-methyltransferase